MCVHMWRPMTRAIVIFFQCVVRFYDFSRARETKRENGKECWEWMEILRPNEPLHNLSTFIFILSLSLTSNSKRLHRFTQAPLKQATKLYDCEDLWMGISYYFNVCCYHVYVGEERGDGGWGGGLHDRLFILWFLRLRTHFMLYRR